MRCSSVSLPFPRGACLMLLLCSRAETHSPKKGFQSSTQGSVLGIGIDPQEWSNEADLSRTLAKQGEDQLGRFCGREELLDGLVMHSANPHFQRWLVLDVAIPIRFPFPPGHHQHLTSLRVVVQDFQNRPAEHSALAATMGKLHQAVSEEPPKTKPIEQAGSVGQPPIDAVGTTMSKCHRSDSFSCCLWHPFGAPVIARESPCHCHSRRGWLLQPGEQQPHRCLRLFSRETSTPPKSYSAFTVALWETGITCAGAFRAILPAAPT